MSSDGRNYPLWDLCKKSGNENRDEGMKRFLSIEDNGQNLDRILHLLREHGYAAQEATDELSQVRNVLRESENRFRMIVEMAEEGIWQVDREWKTTYVNRRMERMLGCQPDSMLSLHILDFMDEEGRRTIAEHISRREGGLHETHDFRFVRRDGSMLDALVSATPLFDERGEFAGSFAMVTDITERKRTENVMAARMRLLQFAATHTMDELLEAALDEAEKLTGSSIGFYHFLEDDQKTLSLQNWSTRTKEEFCKAEGKGLHYQVSAAGVWVDCIHQRRPVIHNDYASLPHCKGLPPGHAPVIRELVVPVFRGGSIVAVFGVGNKTRDYSSQDAETLSLLADLAWGIVESMRAQEALRVSEQKYRSIVEHAPFGICRSTREGKLLSANPGMAALLKYDSPKQLLEAVNRCGIQDVLFAEPMRREPMIERIFSSDWWDTFENRYRCRDGSVISCLVHARRILDREGGETEFESFLENITERVEAEKSLRESEGKFRVLAETAPAAILLYQGDGIIFVNPAAARLFGYDEAELLEMSFWEWAPPESRQFVRERGLARQRGEDVPSRYEHRFLTKGGETGWAMVSGGTIQYRGRAAGLAIFIDITETKRTEERLQASLADKVVLLKEVHHRVKNNLQIISTLLDLQSESIKDAESLNAFRESQDRIAAMALIHERLYASKDLASVDFSEYIGSLSTHLFTSYRVDPGRITLTIDIGGVSIAIDRAIPFGLIINELVTNSLKHAFPDGRSGMILIRFHGDEDDWVTLTVADTGVGMPPGLDFRNTVTLGLQLVNMLASQLGGHVSMESRGGTVFIIRFCRSRMP